MNMVVERRKQSVGAIRRRLTWPLRLSRPAAWRLTLMAASLTVAADWLTGTQLWMGPLYLVIIVAAAWLLGWLEASAIGFACLGVTFALNGNELYPYSGPPDVWNAAIRIVAVLILIGLMHTARQLYAREWRVSRIDPLTGALNRKAFFELTAPRASSRSWTLLVYADLDSFKELNDGRGHAAGDEALSRFARAVTRAVRKNDVFARMGGDEFTLCLDVRSLAAAEAVAVRLHRTMNAVTLADGLPMRCSVGALILEPGPRSIDHELRAADRLMYEAKNLGASLVIAKAVHDGLRVRIERRWGTAREPAATTAADVGQVACSGPSAAECAPELRKVA